MSTLVEVARPKTTEEERNPNQPLQVPREVVQQFKLVCKSRAVGRSMNDTATRIVQWFLKQEPYVQTAVVNDVDQGMERQYAAALRRLADEIEASAERLVGFGPRPADTGYAKTGGRPEEPPPPPKRPR